MLAKDLKTKKMQANRITFRDDNIRKNLGRLKAKSLAKKTGASRRKNRKFSVVDIILSYWLLISKGRFSYDDWATKISSIINDSVSGQAIWKRITPEIIIFLEQLLIKTFRQNYNVLISPKLFRYFDNVIIQDATHYNLPSFLSKAFPGSYSSKGESATAKIQATFNLRKSFFQNFLLTSFRDNDQGDASRIIEDLNENDLLIRDLGYFSLKAFSKIAREKAYFLSRLKYGVNLFDKKTGKLLNITKLLKNNNRHFDMWVLLGKKERLLCRLVAVPLPDKVVNERIRKAKNNRSSTANHSKEYYGLLKYAIYITNVPQEIWTVKEVMQAYKSRWYIEILFKSWKSYLNIQIKIPERYMSEQRAKFFFYASLLMVNLLVMPVFQKIQSIGIRKNQYYSILKVSDYIFIHLEAFIQDRNWGSLLNNMLYFCRYESRKNRINAVEQMYKMVA